ncbi:MAG TPA: hypothetical protein VFE91_01530 [Nitrososphaerales archaeon]|nr:hypothetical protein [Nitrososphaerales archaeon]
MSQTEPEDGVNARTVQLVKLLTELGPDIPEISRKLGQFKESVRYRYKEKILNKGFSVQANVNHERLGLRRMVVIVEFADAYKTYAQAIFAAMNELSYLVSFARAIIGGEYVVNVSAPEALYEDVREFYLALKDKGIFTQMEILEFDWMRTAPMKAEYYDFDTGRWDFEWQSPGTQDYEAATYEPSSKCKFDYVDLLIIKELQIDANKSLREISNKIGVNYKKLAWHHATHVCARKMLRGYAVNWMGTRYDYSIEKALHRKHRYFAAEVFVRNVSERDVMILRHSIDRLPFIWGEASGKNYFAELALPVDFVVEGLQYIGDMASTMKDRMSLYIIDQTDALSFTIPYSLYNQETKKWIFNKPELLGRFDQLIMQIKVGGP